MHACRMMEGTRAQRDLNADGVNYQLQWNAYPLRTKDAWPCHSYHAYKLRSEIHSVDSHFISDPDASYETTSY